ncbi:MAG: DUF6607 family protein [Steroidobacteraceae bacterium]
MTQMIRRLLLLACTFIATVAAYADDYSAGGKSDTPRYTFSWPLGEGALKPRGGTTQGAPVTLDKDDSAAWVALQQKSISPFERDRRAILAMSGEYRVTFDFLEVATYTDPQKRPAPYQSWGTEKVYVDGDTDSFISLVHILEMRMVGKDGTVSDPMVTKHWRQDWTYEPTHIVEYDGSARWERRKLNPKDTKGRWSQTVYQVDESPRYASLGRWEHTGSFSTWLSADTWRPLPRREWSVRDDYHALIGTNRHTVHATGWTQEENNLKAVLKPDRQLDPTRPYLAREYGMARYERLKQADFAAADRYYERTKTFWDQVRDRWSSLFATRGYAQLRGQVDQLGLFAPLFEQADAIAENDSATSSSASVIDSALREMGAL